MKQPTAKDIQLKMSNTLSYKEQLQAYWNGIQLNIQHKPVVD